ncbi:hypothetical protein ARALYDRAFT_486020 [Arabidopsis lyrata subsp. lyrata]|uniref:Glycine-rich protein n=1 Tax=Arabidopsis lyrata subsp. lyrata TaxID=81972 RepID=D7LV88_ARALL|nr:hypothetical protein ARALYDRAFT_486020 [Arabidopsis lyrata subsp. lyrata]
MVIHKSIKLIAQMLLLLLAIHAHIQAHETSSEIYFPVWRRELLGGGGGGRGGGGGGRGGGGGHGGGGGEDFSNGGRSGGLQSSLFMVFIGYWLLVLYN